MLESQDEYYFTCSRCYKNFPNKITYVDHIQEEFGFGAPCSHFHADEHEMSDGEKRRYAYSPSGRADRPLSVGNGEKLLIHYRLKKKKKGASDAIGTVLLISQML